MKYLFVSLLLVHFADITNAGAQENYPVPPKTKSTLFYLQRSLNKNTIVYEINCQSDGSINVNAPVILYWIRYEEGGIKKELSLAQQQAFGLQCKLADKANMRFVLYFNRYKKRELYLMKSGDNYQVFTIINGEFAQLIRIFIQTDTNQRSVQYVDVSGINPKNSESVFERFIPLMKQ